MKAQFSASSRVFDQDGSGPGQHVHPAQEDGWSLPDPATPSLWIPAVTGHRTTPLPCAPTAPYGRDRGKRRESLGPGHPARLWPPSPPLARRGQYLRMLPAVPTKVCSRAEACTSGHSQLTYTVRMAGHMTTLTLRAPAASESTQRTRRFERSQPPAAPPGEHNAAASP